MASTQISADTLDRLRDYCRPRGTKLVYAVDTAVSEWIDKQEKRTHDSENETKPSARGNTARG